MATTSSTIAIVFEAQDKTTAAVSAVEKSLGGVGTEADASTTKVDKLGKEVDALGSKASGAETLARTLQALAASIVVKEFIDANVEAEKFDKAMTLLKGSSQAAAAEFQYVKDLAKTLGLELASTANAYVQLSAATRGTALEGQSTRDIFEAISKAMSSLGKSSADTNGALLAISQIVSKGTVSLEELRGQLGERLPGAFQIAAKSMGLTTQELDKLVSSGGLLAEEFLPKFAKELQNTFGDVSAVEGFTASLNRLKNQLDETFILIGKAGAFDAATKGLDVAGKAVAAFAGGLTYLGGVFQATKDFAAGSSYETFVRSLQDVEVQAIQTADVITGHLNESVAETARLARDAAAAAQANPDQSAAETARLLRGNAAALLSEIENAIRVASSLDQLNEIGGKLTTAFVSGRISASDFERAVYFLSLRQGDLIEASKKSTASTKEGADAMRRQAEETRKAEEAAQRMKIELEKIASNERIKTIEARVTLNVEQFKAQAQQITAAFESIDTTIESTGDVIGTVLGLFKDINSLDWSARNALFAQLEVENVRRDKALKLQEDLTRAQIEVLRAQADSLKTGDAMIKVDGAGLQPHLEAFMWEILKSIQVRVNQDGLRLLLGV